MVGSIEAGLELPVRQNLWCPKRLAKCYVYGGENLKFCRLFAYSLRVSHHVLV